MSAQEYQQDIAIARDDVTRSWVLKHHNVVSIANAVSALFGSRVTLTEPQEEMAPVSLGSTSRTQSSGGSRSTTNNTGIGSGYGSGMGSISIEGMRTRGSSSGGGRRANTSGDNTRQEISRISQSALEASTEDDSSRAESLSATDLINASGRQGPPIHLTYNKLHNLLLARSGDERALEEIDALIARMDLPPRQVLLEMKILQVELGDAFQSIFDIGYGNGKFAANPADLGSSGLSGTSPFAAHAASSGNFSDDIGATLIWQKVSDHLRLRLQLMESENRVNVLATPMIVAANNQPARLFIGDEQTLVTGISTDNVIGTTGATSSGIDIETEQRNVGQTLIVLPRINADRSVTLTIDQDNSSVKKNGATIPILTTDQNGRSTYENFPIDTVSTSNLQVTAHAQDGLTVAVGGMISQNVSQAEQKVPLLGDIPGLGLLFKKSVRENTRRQLVLLITPWVLETPEESQALAEKKIHETETLNAARRPHTDAFQTTPPTRYRTPLLDALSLPRNFGNPAANTSPWSTAP
jgi:general secretion pathway protein D